MLAPVLVKPPSPEIMPLRLSVPVSAWKVPPLVSRAIARPLLDYSMVSSVPPLKVNAPVEAPRLSSALTERVYSIDRRAACVGVDAGKCQRARAGFGQAAES